MANKTNLVASAILTLMIIGLTAFYPVIASSSINADSELPYTYEFTQRFVIAGERVLTVTITNNSAHHIEALEFEARLLDAFGDVISEWSTFTNPDLRINSGESKSLTLTLSRQNILGVNVENLLDKARSFELRYTRIVLGDGTLLRMNELHPNTEKLFGQYLIQLEILNNNPVEDETNYNFERVSYNSPSRLYKYIASFSYSEQSRFQSISTLSQLVDMFESQGIILLARVTNVSNNPSRKDWESSYNPPLILLDDKMNQYSQFALLYAPQMMSNVAGNKDHLPGVTLTMVYVFDKFDGYNPKEIEAYIDGQKYSETLEVYKH